MIFHPTTLLPSTSSPPTTQPFSFTTYHPRVRAQPSKPLHFFPLWRTRDLDPLVSSLTNPQSSFNSCFSGPREPSTLSRQLKTALSPPSLLSSWPTKNIILSFCLLPDKKAGGSLLVRCFLFALLSDKNSPTCGLFGISDRPEKKASPFSHHPLARQESLASFNHSLA